MRSFNAFQIVCSFAGAPFLISWLFTDPFPGSRIAVAVASIAYLIGFGFMVAAVYAGIKEIDR